MNDLISRKAIIKKIEGIFIHVTGIRSGKGILAEWMNKYRDIVLSAIREEPTIEAVPLVHGKWTLVAWHKGLKVCKCSNCNNSQYGSTPLCGHCGARMDGAE